MIENIPKLEKSDQFIQNKIQKENQNKIQKIYNSLLFGCGDIDCKNPYYYVTLLNNKIYEFNKSKNKTPLLEFIGDWFGSNKFFHSFFPKSELPICNTTCLGIDFESVQKVYSLLDSLKDDDITNIIKSSLTKQLEKIEKELKSKPKFLHLRAILIIFELKLLGEPEFLDFFGKFLSTIFNIQHNHRLIIYKWLTKVPIYNIQKKIKRLQNFISIQITFNVNQMEKADKIVLLAYRLLELLNEANSNRNSQNAVDFKLFQNELINNIINDPENKEFGLEYHLLGFILKDHFSICNFPFLLNVLTKSKLFEMEAKVQQKIQMKNSLEIGMSIGNLNPFFILHVRRDYIIEDSLNQISTSKENFKKELKVDFVGEEAVDAGGVQKEFFQIVIGKLFDPNYGMFTYDEKTHLHFFNKNTLESEPEFFLIGAVLGLAIYNQVILDIHFPLVVYKKLLQMKLTLEDLKEVDSDLANGLEKLLNLDGNVEDLDEFFQVKTTYFGDTKAYDLKPNGRNIQVTNKNRQEYVDLYVDFELSKSIKKQFDAFSKGFVTVCDSYTLRILRPEELELLICGDPKFLFFSCGTDRVPIGGFSKMKFTISKQDSNLDRLPSAHTCFNQLLLPEYSSKEILKEKLSLAIQNFQGFGML
ncbi:e3 ubiquitin-protein ligase hectd2-related [Anaeramoeba ignava]|uniref:HECT-type E3 ubiquitin transferase n=1 Tax=Anaeramoeba ignava TaxID=1746090 RepID=A0A9Q0LVQ3_ANAIG|nr:e3 ubiquitin-protein ligase hectd2-related [Anaeramoeba ignava]